MREIRWDGTTLAESIGDGAARARHALADAAKAYRWADVLRTVEAELDLVNSTRPGSQALCAPLHQVGHGGAPPAVAERLIAIGAWRTLPNADGERATDVASRRGHRSLAAALAPDLKRDVPARTLAAIEACFHEVILGRASDLVREARLRLPCLAPLLEYEEAKCWCSIPGMYGGFSFWFERTGAEARLVSETWCRVVGGSGQRHVVTAAGQQLVDEGFV